MILRIPSISMVLFLIVANLHADRTVFEDITYRDLAKNPSAFAGKRIRIRAIYSSMFEVSRLKLTACCADRGPLIWVDFDNEKRNDLLGQIPKGMRIVRGTFIGKIETVSTYRPNGERIHLIVDRIEKN